MDFAAAAPKIRGMSITLRKPTADDVPAIGTIVYEAFASIARKHNFPLDFASKEMADGFAGAFVANPDVVGFVAQDGAKVVGCNFLDKRNPICGVGPICIDPAAQGKGIGRQLMNAVVDAGKGARGIRLVQDAFNTVSMPLYASVGFDVREPLVLVRGQCKSARNTSITVRPMAKRDLPRCAELCEAAHGHDRTGELRDAIGMFRPHVLERGGKIVAYASSPWLWFINHAVAQTEQDLRDLVLGLSAAGDGPLEMLVPTRQAGVFRWLLAEGVKVVKPMTLMTMGFYQEPRTPYWPSVEY